MKLPESYLFFANKFVTTSEPYKYEEFVASRSRVADSGELLTLVDLYRSESVRNPVLAMIFEVLKSRLSRGADVTILDVGVFMGTFSIASHHAAESAGLRPAIFSYEANPELLGGISRNLALHGASARLHLTGVAGLSGYCALDTEQHLISGRLASADKQETQGAKIPTEPLNDLIHTVNGLVKIDIEGFEAQAMGSLNGTSVLNNCFIVEWDCRHDAGRLLVTGKSYVEFVAENFVGLDVGNWNWPQSFRPLMRVDDYENIEPRNSGTNTDIVLLPKTWGVPITRYLR